MNIQDSSNAAAVKARREGAGGEIVNVDQVVPQISTAASELTGLRLFRSGFIGPLIPQRPKKSSGNQWLAPHAPTDLSRSCGVSGWLLGSTLR